MFALFALNSKYSGQNESSDHPLPILPDHANPLTTNALGWLYYSGEDWSKGAFFPSL